MLADVRFDGAALIDALDDARRAGGLDWNQLAGALWSQSSVLNAELQDDALCSGALVRTARRTTMSCQYALIILRWLERPPEDFLVGDVVDVGNTQLPYAAPNHRLRWDLSELHRLVDAHRREHDLTWAALGRQLGCTPNRLTNLRRARLADMELTMRLTQLVSWPARAFIRPQRW